LVHSCGRSSWLMESRSGWLMSTSGVRAGRAAA
jgi:hypothetical protein